MNSDVILGVVAYLNDLLNTGKSAIYLLGL